MNLKEYAEGAARTCSDLGQKTANDLHMILGMVTEIGELSDVYKKFMAYGKTKDMVNVREELGDLMFYIVNFCTMNNLDLESIMEANIAKLTIRYPEKFTEERANNRNLNKEREVLNKLMPESEPE